MKDTELLATAGRALYGERWQTELAASLKISDARRVREWMSGARSVPPGIWGDLVSLLDERKQELGVVRAAIAARVD